MKVTTKFREEKDGRLKLEWRFTAEGRRPRSEGAYDDEAVVCDMALSNLLIEAELVVEQATIVASKPSYYMELGEAYMVATQEYIGPNRQECHNDLYLLLREDNGEGWPGNSDPHVRRYHGWRGTTDDWAVYALGLRRVLDVRVTGNRSKRVVVILGHDIAEDRI